MVNSMTAAGAVPHFHYCDEISMKPLLRLRAALVDDPALKGLKLTFLPFMLKVTSSHLSSCSILDAYLVTCEQGLLSGMKRKPALNYEQRVYWVERCLTHSVHAQGYECGAWLPV